MTIFKIYFIHLLVSLFFLPVTTSAQVTGTSRLYEMLVDFRGLLGFVVPIIFALALTYFFWGTTNFILKDAGNEKTRRDGLNKIIWGVVILFVFVSIYGILSVLSDLVRI